LLAQPFQTLTKRALSQGPNPYVVKNALTSGLRKARRVLLLEKSITDKETVYLLIEQKTPRFRNGKTHLAYTPYRITYERGKLIIEREPKTYFLLNGYHGDVKSLQEVSRKGNVILVTLDAESPAIPIFKSDKNFVVVYREIKTPKLMGGRAGKDTDAFVIFERDFERGTKPLRLQKPGKLSDYTLVAVRAPFFVNEELKRFPYVSSTLSLFFTDGLKGANPHTQETIIRSFIAVWESEAFNFAYAKPKFVPRHLPTLRLRRVKDSGEEISYEFSSSALVFELAYLIKTWQNE